jgi:hypothetical protein
MDAEAFAFARSTQHKQLATRFTLAGVDTAQAKLIDDSINEESSLPFLAAIIPVASHRQSDCSIKVRMQGRCTCRSCS